MAKKKYQPTAIDCRKAMQAKIPGVRLHRQACEL